MIGIPLPAEPKTMMWSCAYEAGLLAEGSPDDNVTKIPHKIPVAWMSVPAMVPREDRSDMEQQGIAPDLSSPEFCRDKAEECLDLSYQITDPKGQVGVLKLANWWMRLAENNYRFRKPH